MAGDTTPLLLSKSYLPRLIALSAGLLLSGCIGNSAFDDLNSMQPVGSAFSAAQFKDYAYLAHSFGTQAAPGAQAFDSEGAISLTGADNTIEGLANAYAQKALTAGRGDEVLPEPAPEGDADAQNVRLELLRDLDDGRDKAPDDAARAQADYDCWILNRRVDTLTAAARSCRRSVTMSLSRLEHETASTPAASEPVSEAPASAPVPAPAPLPPPVAQPATFTVSFASRSAILSADQIAVVGQAISAARVGRQAHIAVTGYADTGENKRLALHRAEAVRGALVEMGARPDAIAVSAGEDQAGSGNHRAVISLLP